MDHDWYTADHHEANAEFLGYQAIAIWRFSTVERAKRPERAPHIFSTPGATLPTSPVLTVSCWIWLDGTYPHARTTEFGFHTTLIKTDLCPKEPDLGCVLAEMLRLPPDIRQARTSE
ncbi:uncharacterized protein N7477_001336 [Penicillium maclennaniae]|uniref:uncharacterized protein n=1 Tax=Penicillium maclennaniae TaxID=1343394 RepID=UPI00253F8EE1|nr:uncharacterized protein N7477_001336 [Penicillium maclennaniae]KAJ5681396.1 hypothetical protein N7477_001336 [Penicillium maclennaniae]